MTRGVGHTTNLRARLALASVAATPIALYVDYRLGFSVFAKTIAFRHLAEDGRRVVTYRQTVGATQVLWLTAGALALARRDTRRGFASAPAMILMLAILALLWTSEWQASIDWFTALAVVSTLLPIYAMVGVLCNPDLDRAVLVRCVGVFAAMTSVVIAATAVHAYLAGQLGSRLGYFMFGSATDAAMALATLLPLSVTVGRGRLRSATVVSVAVGLLLTQTRGAMAGAIVGIGVLMFFAPRFRIKGGVMLVGAAAIFVLILNRPIPLLQADRAAQYRSVYLHAHWHYFVAHPLTGNGLSLSTSTYVEAAHNTILGIADAGGIVVALLWLLAWWVPARRAMRWMPPGDPLPAAGIAAIVGAFICWNTTGGDLLVYVPPTNSLPLVLAAALAMQAARLPRAVHFGCA